MAEEDKKQDGGEQENAPPKSKKKLIIIVALVLMICAGGATFFLLGGQGEAVDQGPVNKNQFKKLDPENMPTSAHYFNMEPEFVINLAPDSEQAYLVIKISLMTRDESMIEFIQLNYPILRSLIIQILTSQRSQDLRTFEGKSKVKERILGDIQSFIKKETGVRGVEEILFTHFIME